MGLDVGHMTFKEMAKAIPPAYAQFAFGEMVRFTLSPGITI